jgi:site-specific recombinase XerD
MVRVAHSVVEAFIHLLVATGLRIGEAAIAEWMAISSDDRSVSVWDPQGFPPSRS